LTVRYTHARPGLHRRLFCKFPHEKLEQDRYIASIVLNQDRPEVSFAQRLAHLSPVPAPKTYFADYSSASTNFLIITERIEFASEEAHPPGKPGSAVLAEFAIERVYDKFMDHLIGSDPAEYYVALSNALGRLVGWYKTDAFVGKELNERFPFQPRAAPDGKPSPMLPQLAKFAINCRCLFADEGVCDAGYQSQLAEEITFICAHRGVISRYLYSDADYIAYVHPNANIDNAYWWRDDAGTLQCGLIDFGGYSCATVTAHLATGLFSAEAEVIENHMDAIYQSFIDGCAAMGGPVYDLSELRLRMELELAVAATFMPGSVPMVYKYIKAGEWASIKDRHDPKVAGREMNAFLARSYAMNVVNTAIRFKRQGTYEKVKAFVQSDQAEKAVGAVPLGF